MVILIVRRLASLVPTLFLLSIAVFALSIGIGDDRAAQVRAGENPSVRAVQEARELLHLNDPIGSRYLHWVSHAARFDFGRSFVDLETVDSPDGPKLQGTSVSTDISKVVPRTLSLAMVALTFAILVGVGVGTIGGVRPGSTLDRLTMVLSTLGLALPSFWIGMLLVSWLAVANKWLPAVGYEAIAEGGFWGWFSHLVIPGIALGLGPAAVIARQMRSALAEVMGSAYIRTAWAKGASLRRVVFRHAWRNAASAPLTVFGLVLIQLLSGTVVIETLFGISGMGQMIVHAVKSSDLPVLQGVVMMFAVFAVMVNLIIDIVYGFLNPKLRLS